MTRTRIALVGLAAAFVAFAQADTDASPQTATTGGLIAFVRPLDRFPETDIFLVDEGGQRLRRLTRLAEPLAEPAWSPDGGQIAFEIQPNAGNGRMRGLWIMKPDGSEARRVTRGQSVTWSPKAEQIAFSHWQTGVPRVFIANKDGSARRQLVGDADHPAWSPDGRWVAFLRNFASKGEADNDIFVTRVKGGHPQRLTRTPELDEGRPSWSPDGRKLLYAATRGYGDYALYVMSADGTNRRMLMHGFHFWKPAWPPDGGKIVFSSSPHLYVANADGSGKKRLMRNGFDPAWRPVP